MMASIQAILAAYRAIEFRQLTECPYVVNDPVWGYFGGYSDDYTPACGSLPLYAEVDNGHMRLKVKNAAKFYDGNHDFYYGNPTESNGIKKGWNWINSLSFNDVPLSDIEFYDWRGGETVAEGDIIKGKDGKFATYTSGAWVGELTELKAGHGYSYYANTDNTYSISANWNAPHTPRNAPRRAEARPEWEYDGSQFITNMSVIADIAQIADPEDYTIGTFVGGECRGEGKYIDGRWFIFAHGEQGDVVSFKVKNRYTGAIVDLNETMDFAEMSGSYNAPVDLTAANKTTSIEDIMVNGNENVYANGQTICGEDVEIYDINGRNVTAANGELAPGMYIVRSNDMTQKVNIK